MTASKKKDNVVGIKGAGNSEAVATKRTAHLTMQITPQDPGYKLIYAILAEINRRGITSAAEACEKHLRITPGYFSLLKGGKASPSGITRANQEAFAEFLNITPMAVMMLADAVPASHFYPVKGGSREALEKQFDAALNFILNSDEAWAAMMPAELFDAKLDMKIFAVRAYEQANNKTLVNSGLDHGKLIEDLS